MLDSGVVDGIVALIDKLRDRQYRVTLLLEALYYAWQRFGRMQRGVMEKYD